MGKLAQEMIQRLRERDAQVFEDLWIVSDLLKKAWTTGPYHSGFPEIDAEQVAAEEAGEIRTLLLEVYWEQREVARQRQLLCTLGGAGDRSSKELLIKHLHVALEMHRVASANLWSVLYSLERIGEPVFELPRQSRGLDTIEDNVHEAEAYLKNFGIFVPL